MTKDSKHSSDLEGTRVDLGDDLLEKTAELARPASPQEHEEEGELGRVHLENIDESFKSAKILVNEGLTEEAKKLLRRILIVDSHYAPARKFLTEIHELELKQIFGEDRRRPALGRAPEEPTISEADAEEILRELDRDLELGILSEKAREPIAPFGGDAATMKRELEDYAAKLEAELKDLSGQDRMDLGVGFLEMGLHELAMRQFKAASTLFMQKPETQGLPLLSATALLVHASIQAGQPFEATLIIQGVLRDSEIKLENKVEFFYQMGRAYDAMKKPKLAVRWYEQARAIDPQYRDLDVRLRGKR